jgi:signal transduction histidine kinase
MVKRLENRKVNQELNDQRIRFVHDFEHNVIDLSHATIISGGLIKIMPVETPHQPEIQYADTLIFDPIHQKFVPYRSLSYYTQLNNKLYKMSIYKSLYESNYVVEQVALIIIAAIVVFLLMVYFLYRYYFGQIWSDFFASINKIEHFNLSSPEKLDFSESSIIEFNQLNSVLEKMVNRINSDFQGMKDYTGNLTHEIQTPLAVIRSKTDLLLQDKNSTEQQMLVATEINAETVRLSKLVKALNLLTRIDHKQFPGKEAVDIEKIINGKIESFEDFIESKNLKLSFSAKEKCQLDTNPELADILFGNLLKNAIRHNINNGTIGIEVCCKSFSIKNSGNKIDFDPEILFNRFIKFSNTTESLGIGLSIVKKICDFYDYKILYKYFEGMHELTINFNN